MVNSQSSTWNSYFIGLYWLLAVVWHGLTEDRTFHANYNEESRLLWLRAVYRNVEWRGSEHLANPRAQVTCGQHLVPMGEEAHLLF